MPLCWKTAGILGVCLQLGVLLREPLVVNCQLEFNTVLQSDNG